MDISRLALIFCLSLVVQTISNSAAAAKRAQYYALVIGVNQPPREGTAPLRYADDDALAMHDLLSQAGVSSELFTVMDEDTRSMFPEREAPPEPTLPALREAFKRTNHAIDHARQAGANVELFLFYSGHGDVAEGEGFVALQKGRLTRSVLFRELLEPSSASQIHVIIDACKSYYLAYGKGPGGERTPFHHPIAGVGTKNNVGFVLSTSSDHDSHEWERFGAGIFSHEVRSALRGAADVDRDGKITYAELGAFLTVANQTIANPKYRPRFLVKAPGPDPGELEQPILSWQSEYEYRVSVDTPHIGHFYLENTTGMRLLDAHPAAEQTLAVYLPPDRPVFLRLADESEELVIAANTVSTSSLSTRPTEVVRKGALHIAFESLFSKPLDTAAVPAFSRQYRDQSNRDLLWMQPVDPHAKTKKTIRQIAFGTAIGSALVGGSMTISALAVRSDAAGNVNVDPAEVNRKIEKLNTTAIASYSLCGAAAITWLIMKLLPVKSNLLVSVAPVVTPDSVSAGATVRF